ncbi:hypothetical protein Tco_1472408, partial [Tanacetum coccineum]
LAESVVASHSVPPNPRHRTAIRRRKYVRRVNGKEEEDPIPVVQRWTREEETLICECWVEVSKNNEIRADRSDDSFWWKITDDFNKAIHHGDRTKNMITGKWTRIKSYCQKFNAIYKHLERKSKENEADYIDTAKINFNVASNGRKFLLKHA